MMIFYLGIIWVFRLARRIRRKPVLLVLCYHGARRHPAYFDMFFPPELFAEQMRYLSSHYKCVAIDEVTNAVVSGAAPEQDTVVVTCDDGYEDNYTNMWPVIRRLGIPLHIYVTSDCVQKGRPTFILSLMQAMDATSKQSICLPELGLGELALTTEHEREQAIRDIDGYARPLKQTQQDELLDVIYERLEVDSQQRSGGMLTWAQIREMSSAGVVIGSHTRTHPVLADLTAAELRDEIAGSKLEIERATGIAVRHFAYPYGSSQDISELAVQTASESGFETAVDLEDKPSSDWSRYRIGRRMLTVDRTSHPWGGFSPAMFACEVEGIASLVFRFRNSSASV